MNQRWIIFKKPFRFGGELRLSFDVSAPSYTSNDTFSFFLRDSGALTTPSDTLTDVVFELPFAAPDIFTGTTRLELRVNSQGAWKLFKNDQPAAIQTGVISNVILSNKMFLFPGIMFSNPSTAPSITPISNIVFQIIAAPTVPEEAFVSILPGQNMDEYFRTAARQNIGAAHLDVVNEILDVLPLKADLVDGVIPLSQLPASVGGTSGSTGTVDSVNSRTGAVVLTKADVGLDLVQNLDFTNPSNIVQTATYRFVTDTEKATWNGKASAVHTHAISDITSLTGILDGINTGLATKASAVHTHAISDITNLQSTLDTKAALAHTHTISNILNLQTTLDGKAAVVHTHAISDIINLQTTIDGINTSISGKAATTHTHNTSEITGLDTQISGINGSITTLSSRVTALENAAPVVGGSSSITLTSLAATTLPASTKVKAAVLWDRHSSGTQPNGYMVALIRTVSAKNVVVTIEEHNTPTLEATPTTLLKTHYLSSIITGDITDAAPFAFLLNKSEPTQVFIFVENTDASSGTATLSFAKQDIV